MEDFEEVCAGKGNVLFRSQADSDWKLEPKIARLQDRGIQYCSTYYQSLHRRHGVRCSMTDGDDCYQNAIVERVNGILKNEFLLSRPADLSQARRMVAQSIQSTTTSARIYS